MPLPHEHFSKQFVKDLNKCLYRARSRAAKQETWCLVHFDQHIDSLETFHSHSGMETKTYIEQLARVRAQSGGDYNFNSQIAAYRTKHVMQGMPTPAQSYVDMHAEEELIKAFPRIYDDWVRGHPAPKTCCLYLNWSPCLRSQAKVINGVPYPIGCHDKVVTLANQYRPVQCYFTVYFDKVFGTERDRGTTEGMGFISFAPMPDELRKDLGAAGQAAADGTSLFSGSLHH